MKVKRMVKRLFAVSAGVAMLGATAMGAMAQSADLGDYPNMFVNDGVFDGFIVVGAQADSVDTIAAGDIPTGMFIAGSGSSGSATTISGDAWRVESGTDVLEFGESFGSSAGGVVDFIDETELGALVDHTLTSSQGTFTYEQFIHFDNPVINVTYSEDDEDVTDLFLWIKDNSEFARYELNFLEAAESDIDASESFKLDDYEDKVITLLGKDYNIVKAVTGGAGSAQVTLTLMAGSVSETLEEGQSATYNIGGKSYDVALTFTDSNDRAKFTINGEVTPLMEEGDTETLSDGTVIGLSEVLYQDYAGGIHNAEFFLGADKIVLEDDAVNVTGSSDELQVNDETIDGAEVEIQGTFLNPATSSTDDGELEIDTIYINMTAEDDYYVAAGETLSEQPELEEKDLLFTQGWDIRFEGLDNSVETDMIKLQDTAGEKEYELTFTNVNGDEISFPLAYASGSTLRWGDQDDRLVLNPAYTIGDENYFILNDDTDEDSITHVVQYKGADKKGTSDPKLKFRVLATGETLERPVTFGATQATATLRLGGTTYNIVNMTGSSATADVSQDDWNITVTGGSTTFGNRTEAGATPYSETNYLIARGGARISLFDTLGNTTSNHLSFNVSLIDADRIDDAQTVTTTDHYLVASANISASSSEVDLAGVNAASVGGISLISPDDDDDNSYGYSSNGAWMKLNSPSGSGTSADNIEIEWPQNLRAAEAYVTSGSTTRATRRAGNLMQVQVVDAFRLDSEVSSVSAQNLIVVGGPCVNTVAAELMGNPAQCAAGFTPGRAKVKLYENQGSVAMVVAGYSGADTRLAGRVLARRADELSGMEVEIEGTSYSDATIGAPVSVSSGSSQ